MNFLLEHKVWCPVLRILELPGIQMKRSLQSRQKLPLPWTELHCTGKNDWEARMVISNIEIVISCSD